MAGKTPGHLLVFSGFAQMMKSLVFHRLTTVTHCLLWFSICFSFFEFFVDGADELYVLLLAGTGSTGYNGDNQASTVAQLSSGVGVCTDTRGNVFIADFSNYRLRKSDVSGIITTIVGTGSFDTSSGDGTGFSTSMGNVEYVVIDTAGTTIYFSDLYHVWKYDSSSGIVSRYAGNGWGSSTGDGGPALSATFESCDGLWLTTSGLLYIGETTGHRVRVVDTNGIITAFAGTGTNGYSGDNGPANDSQIDFPRGLYVDSTGNMFIADDRNGRIRKVDPSGIITTYGGGGSGSIYTSNGQKATDVELIPGWLYDVKGDRDGNIYFPQICTVQKIDTSGVLSRIIGTNIGGGYCSDLFTFTPATSAEISYAYYLWVDTISNIYVTENNGMIHKTVLVVSPTLDPTIPPNLKPSDFPSPPSFQPSSRPYGHSSNQPSSQPSGQLACRPTSVPSCQPSSQPTVQPLGVRLSQPSKQPSTQPSRRPVSQPSVQPTGRPSSKPSDQPIGGRRATQVLNRVYSRQVQQVRNLRINPLEDLLPSSLPSIRPSSQPSVQPTGRPISKPSGQPTGGPTGQPTKFPTSQPSARPTNQPSCQPTVQPFGIPSSQPSRQPSGRPSGRPSRRPSSQPSVQPTGLPSSKPSGQPTGGPTGQPTKFPTSQPSVQPTNQPSSSPTCQPSCQPTVQPFGIPSSQPSGRPSRRPSSQPSVQPTGLPSSKPSDQPTGGPTGHPTNFPSSQPSVQPTNQPSSSPTSQPSCQPTVQPFGIPSSQPSELPSGQPSGHPSNQPTSQPSGQPAGRPTSVPSCQPSSQPTLHPSGQPSVGPSIFPSAQPSVAPLSLPTGQPSVVPSVFPTGQPSVVPLGLPTGEPSVVPSKLPSSQPSVVPSILPTDQPSVFPSVLPSGQPSVVPSGHPSAKPFGLPTSVPSISPTVKPSNSPTASPSSQPSTQPSSIPTNQPTQIPTVYPSNQPSGYPSSTPSSQPSSSPTCSPSSSPSTAPSLLPSSSPSTHPSSLPSALPSGIPSSCPSVAPSAFPSGCSTVQPSCQPTGQPAAVPTDCPSNRPSSMPSVKPSQIPSTFPTCQPSSQPSSLPTLQPFCKPSAVPSYQPSAFPSTQPAGIPTSLPTTNPTMNSAHCKNGTYYSAADDSCFDCPLNSFSNSFGKSSCECSAGYFSSSTFGISLVCTICPKGQFSSSASATCSSCSIGTFSLAGQANACTKCPLRTYNPLIEQSECLSCPAGRITSAAGSAALSDCVSPIPNFTIGFFSLFFAVILFSTYVIHGRFRRLSDKRKESTVMPLTERCKELIEYFNNEINEIDKTSKTLQKRDKPLIIVIGFILLSIFIIITCVIFAYISLIYQVFFTSLILFRGLHLSFPSLLPILALMTEGLKDLAAYIHCPIDIGYYAAFPFLAFFEMLASFNINLSTVNVTCSGAQAPIELLINCGILGLTIIFIRADYQLLFNIVLAEVNKSYLLFSLSSTVHENSQRNHGLCDYLLAIPKYFRNKYIWFCFLVTLFISVNPFQLILRYSLGFVNLQSFAAGNYHLSHKITSSCDNVPQAPYVDSVLGYSSSFFAWWFILPVVYCLAEVIVPKTVFDDDKENQAEDKRYRSTSLFRNRTGKVFPETLRDSSRVISKWKGVSHNEDEDKKDNNDVVSLYSESYDSSDEENKLGHDSYDVVDVADESGFRYADEIITKLDLHFHDDDQRISFNNEIKRVALDFHQRSIMKNQRQETSKATNEQQKRQRKLHSKEEMKAKAEMEKKEEMEPKAEMEKKEEMEPKAEMKKKEEMKKKDEVKLPKLSEIYGVILDYLTLIVSIDGWLLASMSFWVKSLYIDLRMSEQLTGEKDKRKKKDLSAALHQDEQSEAVRLEMSSTKLSKKHDEDIMHQSTPLKLSIKPQSDTTISSDKLFEKNETFTINHYDKLHQKYYSQHKKQNSQPSSALKMPGLFESFRRGHPDKRIVPQLNKGNPKINRLLSYYELILKERDELHNESFVPEPFATIISFLGLAHFITKKGRYYWKYVLQNYCIFFMVSVGYWNDLAVESYDLQEIAKILLAEKRKAEARQQQQQQQISNEIQDNNDDDDSNVGTPLPRSVIQRQRTELERITEDKEDLKEIMPQIIQVMITSRVILLQIFPYLIGFSVFSLSIASFPLFLENEFLQENLPKSLLLPAALTHQKYTESSLHQVALRKEMRNLNISCSAPGESKEAVIQERYSWRLRLQYFICFWSESRLILVFQSLLALSLSVILLTYSKRYLIYILIVLTLLLPSFLVNAMSIILLLGKLLDITDEDLQWFSWIFCCCVSCFPSKRDKHVNKVHCDEENRQEEPVQKESSIHSVDANHSVHLEAAENGLSGCSDLNIGELSLPTSFLQPTADEKEAEFNSDNI
jgi:hypothetical protein